MNTIKDAECRETSPVIYGCTESPVYGLGKRITPRHPGKRGTPYAESIHLPELLPLEEDERFLGFTLDNKKSLDEFVGDAVSCVYHDIPQAIEQLVTGRFHQTDIYTTNWQFPAGAFKGSDGGPC